MMGNVGRFGFRLVSGLLIVECGVGCLRNDVAGRREVWPDPAELVRFEMVSGVSVLAPFASVEQGEVSRPWGNALCTDAVPIERGGQVGVHCAWYGNHVSRTLAFVWYPGVLRDELEPVRQLSVLAEKFSLSEGGDAELRPLHGRWIGWAWTLKAEGNLIRNRYIVVGCDVVFIQAVSEGADLFEEASLFFDSLAVDWGRRGVQSAGACRVQ